MIETATIVTLALLLDRLLGELKQFHPLVGFGRVAHRVELILFRGEPAAPRPCGVIGWIAMILPVLFLGLLLAHLQGWVLFTAEVLGLYLVVGGQSLSSHAHAVSAALQQEDLPQAQQAVGCIVSRQTDALNAQGVAKAATESVLENGSDAIFGALFWFLLLGLPGALLYRAINTLDAMWGYKTPRYIDFGWFSARVDDWVNWIPARLSALSYALLGHWRSAIYSWRTQAKLCKSPNAGVVMSTGAGALQIELGGEAHYNGKREQKPLLGCGDPAQGRDISRAIQLVQQSQLLWLVVLWCTALLQRIIYG
ncbi:MAG: cobalamin biosynthesis protein [Gammaproteobacteria bacterium]|nr:cobalamin biosynthesis protein [Gammaproteobacteria bacterium]